MTKNEEIATKFGDKFNMSNIDRIDLLECLDEAELMGKKEGMEMAAELCIQTWKNETNERNESALTSYKQNQISHGCIRSAKEIRKAASELEK